MMAAAKDELPPAQLMDWVSRVLAVVVVMVALGFAGSWLDRRFQTSFLTPVFFAVGLAIAIYYLLLITKNLTPPGNSGTGNSGKGPAA